MWKDRKEIIREYYIHKERVKKLKTRFYFLNEYILSPSIITLSARPSVGKSLLCDQIGHEMIANGFRWLSFQLELSSYETIKRELICNNVSKKDIENYLLNTMNVPVDVVEFASISSLDGILNRYRNEHPDDAIFVSIDHLFLINGTDNGKNLQPVFQILVKYKKMGMYFLVLSHLKRELYTSERIKNGSINNLIFESDVYMSDVVLQYADYSIGMDAPYRRGIMEYGPNKIKVDKDDYMLICLKNRNGNRQMFNYKQDKNLQFKEVKTYEDIYISIPLESRSQSITEDVNDELIF